MFLAQQVLLSQAASLIAKLPRTVHWSLTITDEDGEGEDPTEPSLNVIAHEDDELKAVLAAFRGPWETLGGEDAVHSKSVHGIEVNVSQ